MIARLLNGLVAILGAVGFTQFPAFYQQYLQRLGGRLDQTRLDMDRLLADARAAGQSLEQHIQALRTSDLSEARQAGERELDRIDSAEALRNAYEALSLARPFERPTLFAQHFDPEVARNTLNAFEPAVPATPEALVYAATGMLIALLIWTGLARLGRGLARPTKGGSAGAEAG